MITSTSTYLIIQENRNKSTPEQLQFTDLGIEKDRLEILERDNRMM